VRRAPLSLIVPLLASLAAPLVAQSTNYTVPGSLGRPLVDREEAVERAVEQARWRWGGLRVDPWLALRELAWVEERDLDGGTTSDLTATAGAGLDLYLPVGPKSTLAAEIRPEYVWWRDDSDRSRLAGRYALGGFVFSNRLTLELVARSNDSDGIVTPELDRRVESLEQRLDADLEVRVWRRIALFARGSVASVEVGGDEPVPGLDVLDRDEDWWVGGVRLKLGDDVSVGVGAGRSQATFDSAGDARDTDGDTLYGDLRWVRPKLQVSLELFDTELQAASGSAFPGFDDLLYTGRVRWMPREAYAFAVYAQSSLAWSLGADGPYYVDERLGTEIGFRGGERIGLRAFYEQGDNTYAPAADGSRRVDDTSSYGAGLDLRVLRSLVLEVETRRTEVDSPLAGADREFSEIRAGLRFGGESSGVF